MSRTRAAAARRCPGRGRPGTSRSASRRTCTRSPGRPHEHLAVREARCWWARVPRRRRVAARRQPCPPLGVRGLEGPPVDPEQGEDQPGRCPTTSQRPGRPAGAGPRAPGRAASTSRAAGGWRRGRWRALGPDRSPWPRRASAPADRGCGRCGRVAKL